jgi:dihydrodipicolinate synthase/N-acetylneuraminate lyase
VAELNGVNLAMQTPMHADGSIGCARREELIDVHIDCGVHGLALDPATQAELASRLESPGGV